MVIEGGLVIPEGIWGNQEGNIRFICPDTCPGTGAQFRHVPLKVACAYQPITKELLSYRLMSKSPLADYICIYKFKKMKLLWLI